MTRDDVGADVARTCRRPSGRWRYVTNGVHVPTWIAGRAGRPLRRRISAPTGCDRQDDPALWDGVLAIPDEELWAVRQALRRYLFTFIRERARQRWTDERVGTPRIVAAGTLLDPDALTIGFARRFTGYKRPELIFHDAERLARILNAPGRPVQIIFAGKSHPADDIGKHHLQRVYRRALDPLFGGRVAFVDDYDLHVAHFLVQGCDVWLNNPRKPLEASGTSGMKAAINGVPHLSIGDGWWAEGFNGTNGWVIDGGVAGDDPDAVDAADAERALPAARGRGRAGVLRPRRRRHARAAGCASSRKSIRSVAPRFSRAAHGQGVRRADVRAGARREVENPRFAHLADRRMMNDLDAIAVRIAEVARPRAVAMGARLRVERHAAALQKRRPADPRRRPRARSARDDRAA